MYYTTGTHGIKTDTTTKNKQITTITTHINNNIKKIYITKNIKMKV
jgi:hypothetical protein